MRWPQRLPAAYFVRPHHRRERGLQRVLQRASEKYLPRSMPLDQATDAQVRQAVDRINNRPRKCFAFKTPSRSCKTPSIPVKLPSHPALHFTVECR